MPCCAGDQVCGPSATLVYDRSITPEPTKRSNGGTDVARWLEQWLLTNGTGSTSKSAVTVWDPDPAHKEDVDLAQSGLLAKMLESQTRSLDGTHAGMVELRGRAGEFITIIGIDDEVTVHMGDRLHLPNDLGVQILGKTVDGKPAEQFARDFFKEACLGTAPAWGAIYRQSEYDFKVMQQPPSIDAVGRDFGRFLP